MNERRNSKQIQNPFETLQNEQPEKQLNSAENLSPKIPQQSQPQLVSNKPPIPGIPQNPMMRKNMKKSIPNFKPPTQPP